MAPAQPPGIHTGPRIVEMASARSRPSRQSSRATASSDPSHASSMARADASPPAGCGACGCLSALWRRPGGAARGEEKAGPAGQHRAEDIFEGTQEQQSASGEGSRRVLDGAPLGLGARVEGFEGGPRTSSLAGHSTSNASVYYSANGDSPRGAGPAGEDLGAIAPLHGPEVLAIKREIADTTRAINSLLRQSSGRNGRERTGRRLTHAEYHQRVYDAIYGGHGDSTSQVSRSASAAGISRRVSAASQKSKSRQGKGGKRETKRAEDGSAANAGTCSPQTAPNPLHALHTGGAAHEPSGGGDSDATAASTRQADAGGIPTRQALAGEAVADTGKRKEGWVMELDDIVTRLR